MYVYLVIDRHREAGMDFEVASLVCFELKSRRPLGEFKGHKAKVATTASSLHADCNGRKRAAVIDQFAENPSRKLLSALEMNGLFVFEKRLCREYRSPLFGPKSP
jgi:hypothetical protein